MVLELLRARPRLYRRLRKDGTALTAMEDYALELKTRHEFWTGHLAQARAADQASAAALEFALEDLQKTLRAESSAGVTEPPSPGGPPRRRRMLPE
jgi:hypothetical protein